MNKVILSDNLTKDPEVRYTQNNTAYARITIAVKRAYNGKEAATDFLDVTIWGREAEFCGRYFEKGSAIQIEGRIQNNNYTDKHGVKHYQNSIIADRVEFAGAKKKSTDKANDKAENDYSPKEEEPTPPPEDDPDLPF